MRLLIAITVLLPVYMASAQDAVEAAASCIVVHDQAEADSEDDMTCFENISLEKTAFESGVCQWKTDAQAEMQVQTSTTFVPHCPGSYSAFCDVLVLNPRMVAPVKIYLYDKSPDVLERAKAQCHSGGGRWHENDDEKD